MSTECIKYKQVMSNLVFSASYDPDSELIEEMEDMFSDERLKLDKIYVPNPLGYFCDLGDVHQQFWITPHFL